LIRQANQSTGFCSLQPLRSFAYTEKKGNAVAYSRAFIDNGFVGDADKIMRALLARLA
jgi:hypothetical protein